MFDLDGTIIDSTEAILESFEYAQRALGEKISKRDEILELIGHPLDFMFEHLGTLDVERAVKAYKEHYKKIYLEKTTLLKGADEAVYEAAKFAKVAVVTTKTSFYSRLILEHFGLSPYVETVVGREDVIRPKPDSEPVLKALSRVKGDRKRSWMIGDTCLDAVAAKSAGVKAVGVLCGYGKKEALKECSHHLCEDALEAVRLIGKIESQLP